MRTGVVYNWHNEFGMTFSPCCKWVLIESGGGGVVAGGGIGEAGEVGVGAALAGGQWGYWVEITAVKMAVQ